MEEDVARAGLGAGLGAGLCCDVMVSVVGKGKGKGLRYPRRSMALISHSTVTKLTPPASTHRVEV